jgi:glycosyltransferase involved in cell wall biosynthesis
MTKNRISLFVHNLQENPIVRAAPIGLALERLGFEVEVLGLLHSGQTVYAPYAEAFEYKTSSRIWDLAKMATGDVMYSFKPLMTTLLPSMIAARFGIQKPVLLDIEDDDLGVCERSTLNRIYRLFRSGLHSPKRFLRSSTHLLTNFCEAVTVSTSSLQKFYGGTKLLHGPNEEEFDPSRSEFEKGKMRDFFDLPQKEVLVLFAGKPHVHKGVFEIIDAVEKTNTILVLAGDSQDPTFVEAKKRLGARCILLGFIDNQKMPNLLAAVDIVPVPQRDVAYARAQLPAKLIEAMAMGKSVIVSDVGDLTILVNDESDDRRGWLVRPNNANDLAEAIKNIVANPIEAKKANENARAFFVENASVSANAKVLESIFRSQIRLKRFL